MNTTVSVKIYLIYKSVNLNILCSGIRFWCSLRLYSTELIDRIRRVVVSQCTSKPFVPSGGFSHPLFTYLRAPLMARTIPLT